MRKTKRLPKNITPTLDVEVAPPGIYVASGVTLLDLACTDTHEGFCQAGHCVNMIGDRDVGKTALAVASMAETHHRHGDVFGYDFYDAENAYTFQTARLWGKRFAEALRVIPVPPEPEWSIEALAHKIVKSLSDGKPRFIVIDSMDLLRPRQSWDAEESVEAGKTGFNTLRARANKYLFNVIVPKIAETRSFLIYLSQATCNMGFGAMFNPKVRGGGTTLGFNAFVELWLSQGAPIKSGNTKVGHWVIAKTARSKANGKKRTITFPILPAYGIDDTRANVEWLVEQGCIKRPAAKKESDAKRYVVAGAESEEKTGAKPYDLRPIGIEYLGPDPYLFIEQNDLSAQVVQAVREKWEANEREFVEATLGGRKARYE